MGEPSRRPSTEELAAGLATFLGDALARPGLRVEGLGRPSGGASRETFAADLVDRDGSREAVIVQPDGAGGFILGERISAEAWATFPTPP